MSPSATKFPVISILPVTAKFPSTSTLPEPCGRISRSEFETVLEITFVSNLKSSISRVFNTLNLTTVGSDKVTALKTLDIDDLRFDTNVISSTVSNSDIEILPHGSGKVDVQGNLAVTGNIDITGNLVADGDITISGNVQIGDEATDTISITAGITSDLKPDATATYNLGNLVFEFVVINYYVVYVSR
jgi:hypothetical protein